ncbi:MAG: homoserine dehydrogenase [Nitrososphaerota archaeon]|jgi:homoserine dehydrogenase|nr:homoserine dehydrogenase [Nitrososphaerota archaeon]
MYVGEVDMRIILVGYGIVGKGVTTILANKYLEKNTNCRFNPKIVAIADIDGAVINSQGFSSEKLEAFKQKGYPVSADAEFGHKSMSALEVIESVEAEVIVEVTPVNIKTAEPALSHITKAFKSGKHVVTTNKGPLALAMPALTELAEHNNVFLRFSGTVGGGTPMLEFAKRCLVGDKILRLQGILNGTTNYILSEMGQNNMSFQDALTNAQKMGYAEREPTMDIDGFDTACKIVILSNWIMGKKITLRDVDITGIRDVTLEMLKDSVKRNSTIKLIGTVDNNKASVKPVEISWSDPLCVSGVLNAITFRTEYAADQTLIGRGAGGIETASAVLRDLLDIRHKLASKLLS